MARINFDYHEICKTLGIDYYSTGNAKVNLKDTPFKKCYNAWLWYGESSGGGADVRMSLCCLGRTDWRNLRIAVYETSNMTGTAILFRADQAHLAYAMLYLMAGHEDANFILSCNRDRNLYC